MLKVSIHHEDVTILNVYAATNRASKIYEARNWWIQGEIDNTIITVVDFSIRVLVIARIEK